MISDTRELYEVGLDGKLTGNIRSEFRMGEWEDSFEKQKRQALEDFKNANPDLDSKSDFEKGVMWDNYFKPIAKQWHKLNSTFVIDPVTNEGRYVPNNTYRDSSWGNLPSEVQNLINDEKINDIKFGIKLAEKNIGFENNIYTFPYFLAFMLKRFLTEKKQ